MVHHDEQRFGTLGEARAYARKHGGWYGYKHYTVRGGYYCWRAKEPEGASLKAVSGEYQTFGVFAGYAI